MNKFWFKKRAKWGYGYTPITWEGYGMVVLLLIILLSLVSYFDLNNATTAQGLKFVFWLIITIIIFSYISDKKCSDPLIFKRK